MFDPGSNDDDGVAGVGLLGETTWAKFNIEVDLESFFILLENTLGRLVDLGSWGDSDGPLLWTSESGPFFIVLRKWVTGDYVYTKFKQVVLILWFHSYNHQLTHLPIVITDPFCLIQVFLSESHVGDMMWLEATSSWENLLREVTERSNWEKAMFVRVKFMFVDVIGPIRSKD